MGDMEDILDKSLDSDIIKIIGESETDEQLEEGFIKLSQRIFPS